VLLTSLVSRAQPLIRYELTDSVTLDGGPNPLGLPYARSDDVVTLPAAGGGRVAVYPFRLQAPLSGLLEVRQYRVVHEPAGLQVRVALREEAPADTPVRVRDAWPASSATPARSRRRSRSPWSHRSTATRPRGQVQARQGHRAARLSRAPRPRVSDP
jgi:hypothetical protein